MSKRIKPAKHKAQPKQRVLVNFLQDRSGSMGGGQWVETLNGFKFFIEDLQRKAGEIDYFFTLVLFDTVLETPVLMKPITQVNSRILDNPEYGPRGGTALYDALGETITKVNLSDFDKVIYIIVTDGHENGSSVWNKDSLHSLVDKQLTVGKSTFQYLGAQPETWADAGSIGLGAGQTLSYSPINTTAMYAAMSSGVNNFSASSLRSSRSMTMDFSDKGILAKAKLKTE